MPRYANWNPNDANDLGWGNEGCYIERFQPAANTMSGSKTHLSIVLPAKDEAQSLVTLLPTLRGLYPDAEIVVVDDGSQDDTAKIARQQGAVVVSHPYSIGNGAAVKSGARAAQGRILVFMDADGQHAPEDIGRLLELHAKGYEMAVGARTGASQASQIGRASWWERV